MKFKQFSNNQILRMTLFGSNVGAHLHDELQLFIDTWGDGWREKAKVTIHYQSNQILYKIQDRVTAYRLAQYLCTLQTIPPDINFNLVDLAHIPAPTLYGILPDGTDHTEWSDHPGIPSDYQFPYTVPTTGPYRGVPILHYTSISL